MDLVTAQFSPYTKEEEEWMLHGLKHHQNYFDPEVTRHKSTINIAAGTAKKRILYIPVQTVFMLESLASNPEATNFEIATGYRTVIQAVQTLAQERHIGEIYFCGTNEKTNTFAQKHGFTPVSWVVYKLPAKNEVPIENIQNSSDRHPDGEDPSRG